MKSNLDKMFQADPEAEKNGVDFVVDVNDDGTPKTWFRTKRFSRSNPQVAAAFARFFKPYQRQLDNGTLDPKKEREITVKIFVNSCMINWGGVEIDEKPAEYTPEAAIKLFIALPDLFEAIMEHAQKLENFREQVGNS